MTHDMTQGRPTPIIIRFAIPMLIGSLFQQFYQMTDMIVVGNVIGSRALAAIGLTGSVTFCVSYVISGLATGFTVVTSRYFGAKNSVMVGKSLAGAMYISIALIVVLSFSGVFLAKPLMRLMNTPENIFAESVLYLQICMGGCTGLVLYQAASAVLRAVGDSKTPLVFLVVTSLLNILLDLIFVWALGMGVGGAGLALVIAQGGSTAVMLVYMHRRFPIFKLKKSDFTSPLRTIKDILWIALPVMVQSLMLAIGDMVIASVVNTFGSNVVASYVTGNKIVNFSILFCVNISQAHAVFAGQNWGARNLDRIMDGFRKTFILILILGILSALLLFFFGSACVRLFITETDQYIDVIVQLADQLCRISAVFFIFMAFIFLYNYTLRGMGFMRAPFISSMSELVTKTGLAFVLSRMFGYTGIWYVSSLGWILGVLPPVFYFHLGRWKKAITVTD